MNDSCYLTRIETSTGFDWEGNAADAPYPLRQKLDVCGG